MNFSWVKTDDDIRVTKFRIDKSEFQSFNKDFASWSFLQDKNHKTLYYTCIIEDFEEIKSKNCKITRLAHECEEVTEEEEN